MRSVLTSAVSNLVIVVAAWDNSAGSGQPANPTPTRSASSKLVEESSKYGMVYSVKPNVGRGKLRVGRGKPVGCGGNMDLDDDDGMDLDNNSDSCGQSASPTRYVKVGVDSGKAPVSRGNACVGSGNMDSDDDHWSPAQYVTPFPLLDGAKVAFAFKAHPIPLSFFSPSPKEAWLC